MIFSAYTCTKIDMTSFGEGNTAMMVADSLRTVSANQLWQVQFIYVTFIQFYRQNLFRMMETSIPVISLYKEESARATLLGLGKESWSPRTNLESAFMTSTSNIGRKPT